MNIEGLVTTIQAELFWKTAEPEGNCENCEDMIFLASMELWVRVITEYGFYETQSSPPMRICCACHDLIDEE